MTDPFPSEFDSRKAELVGVIGDSLEKVLQQMNTLNRNLESMIAIGNEFSAVEALWSQFENVMDSTTQTVDNVATVPEPDGSKREQAEKPAAGGGGGGGDGDGHAT